MSQKLNVVVTAFKPFHRGTLAGFANIFVAEMHLIIRDIAVHQSSYGARWVQLPAKPLLDPGGDAKRTSDGRIQYVPVLHFDSRAVSEAFSAAVCSALIRFDPNAFSEGADLET
jgi:hypothetical protein